MMKQAIYLIIVSVVIFLLWNNPALYPLKVLVVFFHESSHALMTIFTGGEVKEMVVTVQQGGHVLSGGGNRFWTLMAGYLGSLMWGVVIYLVAARTRIDKTAMFILGMLVAGIALVFVRNTFGFCFSLLTGVVMMILGIKANEAVNDFILRLIGLTSMIYAPLDIYSDTIQRSHLRSDAKMLAEEFGGTTMLWGGLWIVISTIIIICAVILGMKDVPTEEINPKSQIPNKSQINSK
ncbi:MAG: M50 family metallopeptidase [Desulfobacteraceae bacterium]|nr:M50 family metallopeptidase [Desulfobacteraceae bacterium]